MEIDCAVLIWAGEMKGVKKEKMKRERMGE